MGTGEFNSDKMWGKCNIKALVLSLLNNSKDNTKGIFHDK
jgi:hypothetical protein